MGFFLEVIDGCGIFYKLQWVVISTLWMKKHYGELFIGVNSLL